MAPTAQTDTNLNSNEEEEWITPKKNLSVKPSS